MVAEGYFVHLFICTLTFLQRSRMPFAEFNWEENCFHFAVTITVWNKHSTFLCTTSAAADCWVIGFWQRSKHSCPLSDHTRSKSSTGVFTSLGPQSPCKLLWWITVFLKLTKNKMVFKILSRKLSSFDVSIVPPINSRDELNFDHLKQQACSLKWHKIQDAKSCLAFSYTNN